MLKADVINIVVAHGCFDERLCSWDACWSLRGTFTSYPSNCISFHFLSIEAWPYFQLAHFVQTVRRRRDVDFLSNMGHIFPPMEKRLDMHIDLLRCDEFLESVCQ